MKLQILVRYRRQDAIGTPFCITVDHQTMEDDTVTIRHRDTMAQERIAIKDLKTLFVKHILLTRERTSMDSSIYDRIIEETDIVALALSLQP